MGAASSFNVRCTGWSSSWLVLERKTEEFRSKLTRPSGFGYSMRGHSEARLSAAWSGWWCSVQGALPRNT